MTQYRTRLPAKTTYPMRMPWTVLSELVELNLRYSEHYFHNASAFCEDYFRMLPQARPVSAQETAEYVSDALQRLILFWDILRERGNRYLEHAASGNPPVLAFDYETVLDAKDFEAPVNHSLVRILPPEGVEIDVKKRPFVIVDPRAGHGPGIGGFKNDSQVGVALRAGHPVYFVVFHQRPVPGQTLRDVMQAEARFLRWVATQHPDAPKPSVFGNCQGGWAVTGMAATHPDLAGPLVLSGAPLAYWAGETGKNPMRYLGGLLGGNWMSALAGDLGNGQFDGAYLVSNFESLDLANTFWSKYYHLYAYVDTERERFLDFERWWGGFTLLTTEEIRAITGNLFIGNRLSRGQIAIDRSMNLDLRRIQQPIIIFCSAGDNITPPQQALNWIADLYDDERAIKAAGQVIVYMIHETTGHLGIFVSGKIIRREQQQIVTTLEQIESLPPGLYEMTIIEPAGKNGAAEFDVRLEPRTIAQLMAEGGEPAQDEADFKTVQAVSEYNTMTYDFFISPFVKALSSEWTAELIRQSHYLRVSRWAVSDLNPLLWPLPFLAGHVRKTRAPAAVDNPLLAWERTYSKVVEFVFDSIRDRRDIASETLFSAVYGMMAAAGIGAHLDNDTMLDAQRERHQLERKVQEVLATMEQGDHVDATLRILLLLVQARGYLVRSEMNELHRQLERYSDFTGLSPEDVRDRLYCQTVIVAYAPARALDTLPGLMSGAEERRRIGELLLAMETDSPDEDNAALHALQARLDELLEMPPRHRLCSPQTKRRSARG